MKKLINQNKILSLITSYALFAPVVSYAALDGVMELLESFTDLLELTIPLLFGLCLIYFFWGLVQFILHDAGNDKTREEGKKKIMWGIIALFIFVSIYGILNWIGGTLEIEPGSSLSL